MVASGLTASGSDVAVPGIFQAIQWVTSSSFLLIATSGSWNSSTKLCVPGGTFDHSSAGETASGPACCVYLSGITLPSGNDGLVSRIAGGGGPFLPPPGCAITAPASNIVKAAPAI